MSGWHGSYLASPEAALSRARASKLMVLPLERDVIKFVIPKLDQENTMSQKLSGKVALVTGGTSGIGLATASDLSLKVPMFITGRRQTELDAAVNEIGKNVMAFRAMSQIWQTSIVFTPRLSKSKVWISSLLMLAWQPIPLGSITEEHFDKTFNTNVRVYFSPCRRHCR